MTRTYVDAGVLIAVRRGEFAAGRRAIALLESPDRTFVASEFLRLEVLPKAIYHRNDSEREYFEAFFARVVRWAGPVDQILEMAGREAARYGLNAIDALHVAAAMFLGAEELVTTEVSRKPIHRVTSLRVMTL